ncbi:Oidioi.mRNA.OKI2018_I69.PAR.g9298.t1.cds [Oikopleura dioica]|uniref:Oidioi.mRNA.OKI2018_I69.PAR.g9298.t1.cds n=1 Tax=Oikopleura dioica TaxID=34765 RepID=A0ABN7RP69_OIKDI|nr:Oidioi.mRNA.OKI2018_I69.PAR.g9298.t1.cds [Oikopleura dioica]
MKLKQLASIIGLGSACPDEYLQQECINLCGEDYATCGENCDGTETCFILSLKKDSCTETYSSCVRSCPCEKNCPEGCANCENEICRRLPFFSVLGDQPFADRTQYVMAVDGSERMETNLVIPEGTARHDYLKYAGHAILNDKLYIFGGSSDFKKIARLDECEFTELPIQLIDPFDSISGALMSFMNRVYLCFFSYPYKTCQEFDGNDVTDSYLRTNFEHCYGSMGIYNDSMVVLGAGDWPGEKVRRKVEQLEVGGWKEIAEFPVDIAYSSTVTVPEGMLVLGGWNPGWNTLVTEFNQPRDTNPNTGIYYKQIYLLKENVWSLVGNLNEPKSDATVIRLGEWIVSVAGDSNNNFVERINWDGEAVTSVEIIGSHANTILRPIVFQSEKNFCV